ncbi:motility associated factor glycosyltransferase family protein [Aneurinibacillus danicus]|uniref:Motility accessory factor n=1 Tax=Aneurinibacillus danicus TaxID=267746 RepID=A0A511VBI4_9BACL|nr:6-hydroxymethylpterin diphosphokinase MptE-like protein [Aneurinibacillus danicus]GEN36189.1 hypothetical protein ADA01nite_36490 [Aneurinibacillus danicus]
MMSGSAQQTFVRNLNFFRKHYPSFYELLQGKEPVRVNYRVQQARKAAVPVIEANRDGRWQAIHSMYDPLQEAVRWAQTALKEETTEVILFGLGLGYFMEALLAIKPELRFYILEPDMDIFLHSMAVRDWTTFPWHQVSYLAFGSNDDVLYGLHQSYFAHVHEKMQILELPSYTRIYEAEHQRFIETLKDNREQYVTNMMTTLFFEKVWVRNVARNIEKVASTPSIFSMASLFQDRIIIIAASGPSLIDSIPAIRKAKKEQKALVIGAGTGVNALLKQGIIPDAFVSYDPHDPNYHILKPVFASGIPLIFASTLHYGIVNEYEGPMAHFITSQDYMYPYLDKRFNRFETIADSPTVTLITMQLMLKMGCKAIYLAGQDLAYIGQRSYAEGTSAQHDEVNDTLKRGTSGALQVINNQGEWAETNESFLNMKRNIEWVIKRNEINNIFNLSAYGAKIEGIPYKSVPELIQILDAEESQPIEFVFPEVNPKKKQRFLEILHRDIRSFARNIQKIETLWAKMDKEDRLHPIRCEQLVIEYNSIVDRFVNNPGFMALFYPWMQVHLQHMQRALHQIKDLPLHKHFPVLRDLMSTFVPEAKAALQFYQETFKEMK